MFKRGGTVNTGIMDGFSNGGDTVRRGTDTSPQELESIMGLMDRAPQPTATTPVFTEDPIVRREYEDEPAFGLQDYMSLFKLGAGIAGAPGRGSGLGGVLAASSEPLQQFADEFAASSAAKAARKREFEQREDDRMDTARREQKGREFEQFQAEKGFERELKYCENQRTSFVDEMQGEQRLEHIIFRNGMLIVEKEKTVLQKFLSLYHPARNVIFYEEKPAVQAASEVDWIEMEIEALNAAQALDVDMAEAVMRVENGSKVSDMSSKELKRDLLIFARNNPALFLELATDDNVQLRNFGIKATELGIINLSSDQRTFTWGSTGRKLMNVPFDEHPYTALSHWFKTDEGMEIYTNIEKRLNA